jgi:hypothetical protein
MNPVFVRPAREEDLKKLLSWAEANPATDAKVFTYKNTYTLCAFTSSGVVAYLPVQQPLMMEAVAFHPLATDQYKALAMKELTHALVTSAYLGGSGEIYFLGTNEGTNEFAEKNGFKQVDVPVYRVRVSDLEAGGEGNGSATT